MFGDGAEWLKEVEYCLPGCVKITLCSLWYDCKRVMCDVLQTAVHLKLDVGSK